MEKILIRAFRAVDEPESCQRFAAEHARVLADLGVDSVVVPDDSWARDPNTTVFVAEHRTLGMIAGIRLERATHDRPLRMQTCVAPMAPVVVPLLDELVPNGNAELCGLWNAHRFAGRGVPWLLINAAVAGASQLGLQTIVTFIAEYVAPYAERTGFVPIEHIGNSGRLVYPIPSIETWAMVLKDAITLADVDLHVRQKLMSLRTRPRQFRVEQPKGKEIFVIYDLLIDDGMRWDYDGVMESRRRFAA
ncbi:MAG: hypothetical protein IPG92_17495 [Flavobacteriales bacterium]|nr:hypothetical protein [Flavobacteriales bacterium]